MLYRYEFAKPTPLEEVEETFLLALLGVACLFGECQAHLDAAHAFDAASRVLVVDAGTPVGVALNRLLSGYLAREFGTASFRVERVADAAAPTSHTDQGDDQ